MGIACSLVPNYYFFLRSLPYQGGTLKLMEDAQFKVFLAVWILLSKIVGRSWSDLS